MTVLAVLDCLQSLAPGHQFRSPEIVTTLRADYPHILWDAITVGRILTEISDLSMERHSNGEAALYHYRSTHGVRFVLNTDVPASWRWLRDARTWMQARAEEIVEQERRQQAVRARYETAWLDFPSQ